MKWISAALTDVGSKRTNNEDAFAIREGLGLYVVADGMGGHSSGELASAMAVDRIVEFFQHAKLDEESTWPYAYDDGLSFPANKLKTAISMANETIHAYAMEHPESRGMGTTVVVVLLEEGFLNVAYVGDSRAYLYRGAKLGLLTSDHSWVNEQVRLGHMTGEEASRHPFRNVITKALGTREDAQPDILEVEPKPGDIYLLCTDGLNSMADDAKIQGVLASGAPPQELALKLVDLANQSGGEDNITVILLQCQE